MLPKVPELKVPDIAAMFFATEAGKKALAEHESAKSQRREAICKDIRALRKTHAKRGKELGEEIRVARQERDDAKAVFKAAEEHYRKLANSGELSRLETQISRLERKLVDEGLVPSWIEAGIAELESEIAALQGSREEASHDSIERRLVGLREGIRRLQSEFFTVDQHQAQKLADDVRASIPELQPRK